MPATATAYNRRMLRIFSTCFAALGLVSALSARAEAAPALPPAEPASAATGEPQVIDRVTEDAHVRIEELRVRGQTRKLTVQPKIKGMPPYEIVPPKPGEDPAHDPQAGQRVWFSRTF